MKTTKNDVTTVVCNTCKKSKFTMEGKGTSGLKTYLKAKSLGWSWTNKNVQTCPNCRKIAKAAKVSKTASKKSAKAPVAKIKAGAEHKNGKRPAISSNPISAGQSIGKLARSAKVASAPASE